MYSVLLVLAPVLFVWYGFRVGGYGLRGKKPVILSGDPDMESVIEQMKEDYINGKIDLARLEEYVGNRLRGRTPMRADGFPVYYEDQMLNGTILNQLH